ncbi:hypothetical protein [Rhodococcus globerulus]|uniref:Uncharacterized protein n=1 Tax=Rhodococcus globerulus TaxID=33008 RepID=A0ABU4C3N1_RHOGO|nr:hypothetical protein [Rhodococcus globerulus]MDV6270818.1 hypothetical protein [Rhodococcus globerulus]
MIRPSGLPTTAVVSVEFAALLAESAERGVLPSVLALARRLGIANTTLRRNFPEVVDALSGRRQTARNRSTRNAPTTHIDALALENQQLRTRNRELTEHIALASSQIQQLSREAHQLRAELHQRTAVTTISMPRTSRASIPHID